MCGECNPIPYALSPARGLVKPPSSEETLVWRLVTFTQTLGPVQRLVPRTRLAARALTCVSVEAEVWWTDWGAADALAGGAVEVTVWTTIMGVSMATHTLTGFHV